MADKISRTRLSGTWVPRFGRGWRTFMRLPIERDAAKLDIAPRRKCPWDGGTTNRPGARPTGAAAEIRKNMSNR